MNEDKLTIVDTTIGEGPELEPGQYATMHYTLFLEGSDKVIQSSKDYGQPFTTAIGVGQVIKGWDEGVPGMKVGGVRRLTIHPDWAYGEQGAGDIPPHATLVFVVELLGIK